MKIVRSGKTKRKRMSPPLLLLSERGEESEKAGTRLQYVASLCKCTDGVHHPSPESATDACVHERRERKKPNPHPCTQINTCVLSLASAPIGKCTHAQRAPGEANVASVCLSTSVVVMVSRGHCSCLQPF